MNRIRVAQEALEETVFCIFPSHLVQDLFHVLIVLFHSYTRVSIIIFYSIQEYQSQSSTPTITEYQSQYPIPSITPFWSLFTIGYFWVYLKLQRLILIILTSNTLLQRLKLSHILKYTRTSITSYSSINKICGSI